MNKYKKENSLQFRKEKSKYLLNKYPNKIPIVIQKSSRDKILPELSIVKCLVPPDLTLNHLLINIKSKYLIDLNPSVALYIFTENNKIVSGNQYISSLYEDYKNKEDNFLYLFYCSENTFG